MATAGPPFGQPPFGPKPADEVHLDRRHGGEDQIRPRAVGESDVVLIEQHHACARGGMQGSRRELLHHRGVVGDPQDPEGPARRVPHQAGKVQRQGVTGRIRELHRRDRRHLRGHERLEVVALRFIAPDLYRARVKEVLTAEIEHGEGDEVHGVLAAQSQQRLPCGRLVKRVTGRRQEIVESQARARAPADRSGSR